MPKGHATISWTDANDLKLFLTILTVQEVKLDCQKIATAFGMGVDAQAIRNRVAKLRGKAKDLGVAPGEMSVPAKPGKKQAQVSDKTKAKGAKLGGKKLDSNPSGPMPTDTPSSAAEIAASNASQSSNGDSETHQTDATEEHTTMPKASRNNLQKTIGGRVTKARVSPRKTANNDYKVLGDPFVAMTGSADADGEKVFNTDKSESENSFVSDLEYLEDAKMATIKMEEAI